MSKHKSPQFDLPQADLVFNLVTETTQDGERLRREQEQREQDAIRAAARQLTLRRDAVLPEGLAPLKEAPLTAKESHARRALKELEGRFIGGNQRKAVLQCFRGEEREWFFDKIIELHKLIAEMPKTYEQEGTEDPTVYLHYFAGGQASAWITEKDRIEDQNQAFGLADLFGDGGELGYISIEEWISNGAELDFHFTPCTLAELRKQRGL